MRGRISSLARALGQYRTGNLWEYRDQVNAADIADLTSHPPGWEDNAWEDMHDEPQEPVVEEIYANMFAPAWDDQRGRDYLWSRGVGPEATVSMGLRFDPFQERVLFPVRGPDGSFYGYTGRAVNDAAVAKIKDYSGLKKKQHVLGADRWRPGQVILIIVEGLFAYAHLISMGVEKVADVGALLGSELHDKQRDLIIAHGHSVLLLADNDQGGDACLFGRADHEGNRAFETGAIHALHREIPVKVPAWPHRVDAQTGRLVDDPDQLTKREVWSMIQHTPVWGVTAPPPMWR